MSNELVISSSPQGDRIALLQNRRLIEYHLEEKGNSFTVGDIYLGTVKKINTGLNAVFVDVGYEKDAFLHYLDLGPQIRSFTKYTKDVQTGKQGSPKLTGFEMEPEIDKMGKIGSVLTRNQQILVQVVKEPISTKGPRLSCEISLAGRYIILVPFTDSINISKKIVNKEERQRLHRLIKSIKPENFGVIIRTVAENKEVAELDKDLRSLVAKWEAGFSKLKTAQPREKVIGEMSRASSMLRDLMNESFDGIQVDTKEMYDEVRNYVQTYSPEKERIVRMHNGKNKLFEQTGIERQLKSLFGRTVSLANGGYLVIEHTEALHVIDVNSGSNSNKGEHEDQESNAFSVNCEAAREVARQLRLRDMGGIIIIDFIDQRKQENKRLLYECMKNEMKGDRAKHTVLPLSKFGIMQITRQRVRPEMNVVTSEICPTCNGTGKITASVVVSDVIEQHVDFLLSQQNESGLTLVAHPFIEAYFTKGFPSRQMKWFFKYRKWVKIVVDSSLGLTDFQFRNKVGQEIELQKN